MLNPAKNVKGPGEIIEEAVDFIDQFYTSVKRFIYIFITIKYFQNINYGLKKIERVQNSIRKD